MSDTLQSGMAISEDGRTAGRSQGLLLTLQAVLPTMGAMMLVPVVPLLIREYGMLPGASYLIPAILTVPALCIAFLSPLAGWLGDRFGRRKLLIWSLCLYGAAGVSPIFLGSIQAVIIARLFLGVCEALIITLSATLIGDYFNGQARARWLAMISTVASLSAVVFLALAGLIGGAFGWRWVTALYGLSILFVPAMLFLTWETKPKLAQPVASISTRAAPDLFPWKHMTITGLATLFGGTLFYSFAIQQGMALSSLGVQDPGRLGLLTAIASLANPIGTLVFWRFSQWRPNLLLVVEFTVIGGACSAIGFVKTDLQFATAAFVGLFGCGLLMPTLINWMMGSLAFSNRARGTGIFQSMFMLGQFASGIILAFITTSLTGSLLKSFGVLGAAALAAALLCLFSLKSPASPAQSAAA